MTGLIKRINYHTTNVNQTKNNLSLEKIDINLDSVCHENIFDKTKNINMNELTYHRYMQHIIHIEGKNPGILFLNYDRFSTGFYGFPPNTKIMFLCDMRFDYCAPRGDIYVNDNIIQESSPNSPIPYISEQCNYKILFDIKLTYVYFNILVQDNIPSYKSAYQCYNKYTKQIDPIWADKNKEITIYEDDIYKITCYIDGEATVELTALDPFCD